MKVNEAKGQNVANEISATPAIAQLVEHLTVEHCSNQMVPGSIPGGRTFANANADPEKK